MVLLLSLFSLIFLPISEINFSVVGPHEPNVSTNSDGNKYIISEEILICIIFPFFPGLMITSGSIHYVLSLLNITTNIRDVCVFLAPLFSGFTAIATYLLTKELWSQGAGLFAAGFICIVPGYISRYVKTKTVE